MMGVVSVLSVVTASRSYTLNSLQAAAILNRELQLASLRRVWLATLYNPHFNIVVACPPNISLPRWLAMVKHYSNVLAHQST